MSSVVEMQAEMKVGGPRMPRVRTAVAMFVARFPRIDEPAILREMNELERQGQPVVLVPLLRDHGRVLHEEAKPWLRRALHVPLLSPAVLLSNLRSALTDPRRYFALLGRLISGTIGHPSVLLKTLALFPKSVHLAHILPQRGIRHIHAQFATHPATMAYIVSELSNITYSFTIHGPDVFVHRLMLREKIAKARFVRAVSIFAKAFVAGLYSSVAEQKIEVVHVGVDPAVYGPHGEHANRERPQILSVAALTQTKGFSFVVDACSRLAGQGMAVDFTIVGRGRTTARIQQAIRRFGMSDSVNLVGAQPQHEVARLMRESDIFILPSVIANDGQMDGLPVAIMEAMAAGKPVVAAAISGIPEIVHNGVTGLLVDMTHPERIAEALQLLLNDSDRREKLGHAGREKVEREFDIRVTTRKLIALFDHYGVRQPSTRYLLGSIRWEDIGVIGLGVKRVLERQASVLADVTLSDGIRKRDAIVKRRRQKLPQGSPDEYSILTSVGEQLHDSATDGVRYGVPRVLLRDEEHAAVVMESPQGRPLDLLIRMARVRRNGSARLITPARRAGEWLRKLQARTNSDEDGRHILTALVLLALQDLELVAAAEAKIRKRHDDIVARLRELESRVASRPLPVVAQHGDFAPRNVYIGDRRVEVIDFEDFREGLPLEDVAHFLLTLELFFPYPILRRGYGRIASAFISGYGGEIDGESMQLFMLSRALHILATGGARATGTWRDLFRRSILRNAILRCLD